MPVVVTCSGCQGKLTVPDQIVGKPVKCPRCGQVVRTGAAGTPAAAPKAQPAASPQPAAARAAAAAPQAATPKAPADTPNLLTVTCAGCQQKLKARADLAGKAIKCPRCGKAVKVPAPQPAEDEGEWLEVNEAVVAAAPVPAPAADEASAPAPRKGGPPTGSWGQELLEEKEVPEDMQEQVRSEMSKSERVVWCDRPRVDILLHQARMFLLIAGPICGLVVIGATVALVLCIINGIVLGMVLAPIFGGIFGLGAFFALKAPGTVRKNAPKRACYVLTNRRVLIHPGTGTQMFFGSAGSAAVVMNAGDQLSLISYTGLELTRMTRTDSKRFEQAGDLSFSRDMLEDPSGGGLWALGNVSNVEKMIREKLLHPVIDKLLRGERLSGEEKGKAPDKKSGDKEEGDVVAADSNIKEYGGSRGRAGYGEDASNTKAAPSRGSGLTYDPKKVPAGHRKLIEAELTEGEKVLWYGSPEAGAKGRGFLGAMVGSDQLVEPDYEVYGITNRRVILWIRKKGAYSYYTPGVLEAGVEEDKRITNGGSIVFKRVRRIITTTDKQGKTTTRKYLHSFGLLRISHYKAVAALLYDTLIAPCRDR